MKHEPKTNWQPTRGKGYRELTVKRFNQLVQEHFDLPDYDVIQVEGWRKDSAHAVEIGDNQIKEWALMVKVLIGWGKLERHNYIIYVE